MPHFLLKDIRFIYKIQPRFQDLSIEIVERSEVWIQIKFTRYVNDTEYVEADSAYN